MKIDPEKTLFCHYIREYLGVLLYSDVFNTFVCLIVCCLAVPSEIFCVIIAGEGLHNLSPLLNTDDF